MNRATLFATGKDDWGTPLKLFAELDAEFRFTCDVAADAGNHRCPVWFGPGSALATDALTVPWPPGVAWMNPPYSRGRQDRFLAKAVREAAEGSTTTVALLPARPDTKRFHRFIWDAARHQPRPGVEVRFLPGRLRFVGAAAGAPFPSMVVVFHRRPATGDAEV
jgi:site-specific DNA-methyltransferase (adenine-specific)